MASGCALYLTHHSEARVQLRKVLDDFKPDVCHLNNFNYQLTPSIILEIVKWRKETGRDCKIIFTAHDYQLVCPNCPFSVMESQMYGTPVLGANIGGIPELIQVGKTGELFESGNAEDLKKKIEKLWGDKKLCAE